MTSSGFEPATSRLVSYIIITKQILLYETSRGVYRLCSFKVCITSNMFLGMGSNSVWRKTFIFSVAVCFARRNAVDDVSFLEFLNICPHLEELILAECPTSSKLGYRATIRNLLPNLITLDGIPIAEDGKFRALETSKEHPSFLWHRRQRSNVSTELCTTDSAWNLWQRKQTGKKR
jgi:hypothetical protein